MDNNDSLKRIRTSYDPTSRFDRVDAVEWASRRIMKSIDGYIEMYERGPDRVLIRQREDSHYSPFLCTSHLHGELGRRGLTTRVEYSNNGEHVDLQDMHSLEYDLDQFADEFFHRDLAADDDLR